VQDLAADPSIVVCEAPGGDQMVRVGDFWIDRYEATVWDQPDCTMDVPGADPYGSSSGVDDYSAAFPDTGNWSTRYYACSVPGHIPSSYLTWFQAEQACAASGKRLCTNAEWQAAAAGTYDPPDGAEDAGTAQCRVATTNTGPRETGQAGATPGGNDSCISSWGAEDMVGNVREWTADWWQAGHHWTTAAGANEQTYAWGAGYGDDSTWNLNGNAYHGPPWAYTDGIPAAALRGGYWNHGAEAGVFALGINTGPSYASITTAARCCRSR
jgi:formylglycine-generating enzyme required for sulfatase activity